MDGHIRKRGNKWCVVVFIGLDEHGKRKYKWFSGYKTQKEAKEARIKILSEMQNGTYIEPTKETVETFMTQWLKDKETEIRYNTYKKYLWLTKQHIIPQLGKIELSKLTPRQLQAFYTKLQTMDKPLSARSILHLHTMFHQALDRAVKWNLMARNVADAVDPPRAKNKEMQTWSADEVQHFLSVARSDPYFMVFLLAITTGMRKAEVCGLRWQDIDFENGRAYVRQSSVAIKGQYVFEDVKTDKSRRVVSLPSQVVEELRKHKIRQSEQRLSLGVYYDDNDLVNCRPDGKPIPYTNIQRHWLNLIDEADVPRIRFHDLRHTHATMLFEQGVATKIVSERLGHSRVNVTLDIYTHVKPEQQDDVAQQFGDLLFNAKRNTK